MTLYIPRHNHVIFYNAISENYLQIKKIYNESYAFQKELGIMNNSESMN